MSKVPRIGSAVAEMNFAISQIATAPVRHMDRVDTLTVEGSPLGTTRASASTEACTSTASTDTGPPDGAPPSLRTLIALAGCASQPGVFLRSCRISETSAVVFWSAGMCGRGG